jgi:hypothetical protein
MAERLQRDLHQAGQQIVFLNGVIAGLRERLSGKGQRNPEAICGNCLYFRKWITTDMDGQPTVEAMGTCCESPGFVNIDSGCWCGKHPDFWLEQKGTPEQQAEQVLEGRT